MLFSAKTEYACLAMLELAARHGDPRPVRLAEIAERHGISPSFLVQILIQLAKAGLVTSTRGASGGYQLARSPAEITLAEIFAVVEGADPPAGKRPRAADNSPLARALDCVWDRLHHAHREYLKVQHAILQQTTLVDLIEAGHDVEYVI